MQGKYTGYHIVFPSGQVSLSQVKPSNEMVIWIARTKSFLPSVIYEI